MSLKRDLKEKFGVDVKEMVQRFDEKKDNFRKSLSFDYDVTALTDYKDNTLPDLITDLVANSEFLSMLSLEEGVKGTREIALLNANIPLRAKSGCTTTPDGAVVFTDVDLVTRLLQVGIEFCNEDLNTKMTQMLNVLGVKKQNGQLPAELETILMAYLGKVLQRSAQRVVVNGDTTSQDAELVLMDGIRKRINTGAGVATHTSLQTAITPANGYDIAYEVYKTIDTELLDNGIPHVMIMGRTEALSVLKQWNDTNPYSQVQIPAGGTSMRFQLPLTGVEVMTLPEYNGTEDIHVIPLSLAFLGVDEMADMVLEIKYDEYNDKLKAEASFRLGNNIVWNKYFTKLVLA